MTAMNDEALLLAAILTHPGEDTPRLIYADWLQEHGTRLANHVSDVRLMMEGQRGNPQPEF